jgi:hypothetical protein
MKVIGFGEKKTPQPFIAACNKFIYIEILKAEKTEILTISKADKKQKVKKEPLNKVNPETIKLIKQSVNDLADESGWTFLGELGNYIIRRRPDFDPRNFGFPKLLPLIKSISVFEIDVRETGLQNIKHIYVRHK